MGTRNPRIFIKIENLIISVVPDGPGAQLVEFSELRSDSTSIKGEIKFPIETDIPNSEAFDRILDRSGTSCRFCHSPEVQDSSITVGQAFLSKAFRPRDGTYVSPETLEQIWKLCDPEDEPHRCEILDGLFGQAQVRPFDFPSQMPTFF
ncbi:MAG: hypothetical protein KDD22_06895 [Bdellovibrionales bacterium]|nr:hypothetical protein [Bdellovibrionales bacterium]